MSAEIPQSCPPDKYLTQRHLQELFDDFTTSLTTSRPAASIFSSLVTSIRYVYTRALLKAGKECAEEIKKYAQDQGGANGKPKEEAGRVHECCSCILKRAPNPMPAGTSTITEVVEGVGSVITAWPAKLFTLYIFSSDDYGRRDWIDWSSTPEFRAGEKWDIRMEFKAFKYQEPGMVNLLVLYESYSEDIFMTQDECWEGWGDPGESWTLLIDFWAFDKPLPGTQVVWVGYLDGSSGSILAKGDYGNSVGDWIPRFPFWVPI